MQRLRTVRTPAIPIFVMLAAGATAALYLPGGYLPWFAAAAVGAWQLALLAFVMARVALFAAAALSSIALASTAAALHTDWSRAHVSIISLAAPAQAQAAEPLTIEGVLLEDGALRPDGGSTLQVRVERVLWRRAAVDVEGGVMLSIAGAPDAAVVREWRRGRRIRAPASLRRPSRYLNDGVPDGEIAARRRGLALAGSVKSAALVEVIARAPAIEEWLARVRQRVRDVVVRHTAADAAAGAVVTAILIGDRAGLADDLERRMQRAGTYHVIAISGGNIALFAMLAWGACRLAVPSHRFAIGGAMLMIAAYGVLVGSGASVGRAVAAALLLLFTTLLDHRAPPLNVIAVVGSGFLLWDPLALVDLGFLLSFGATAGILIAVPRWMAHVNAWRVTLALPRLAVQILVAAAATVAATAAAEIALLPVQAAAFHRLTLAGLPLNLIAIPAMAVTQVAGMALLALSVLHAGVAADAAAIVARVAARALLDSAALVDVAPALTWRVASPPGWLIAAYIGACAMLASRRWPRVPGPAAAIALASGLAIAMSAAARVAPDGRLRLSMFDVGQAEAVLLTLPSGKSLLIDAAGAAGRFDIGDRVLVPALAARGVTRLDWFALTHADLDHIGGAETIVTDLAPSRVLEGVALAMHPERTRMVRAALSRGASIESVRAGGSLMIDGVLLEVLHPPDPEWERQAVRNDDSLVIDVRFGAISILLMGDTGEPVEAAIAARLRPSPIRILKVGHHGSRTSTSPLLLDAARASAALISAGRANLYGHPSPPVITRLRQRSIELFRTDEDGQIDVTTDGRTVRVETWRGRRWSMAAR